MHIKLSLLIFGYINYINTRQMAIIPATRQRPAKAKKVKMTLTVDPAIREAIVQEAYENDTTLSSIVRRLMKEHVNNT